MNYEEFKKYINRSIPNIPEVITEEWLKQSLKNLLFNIWGFSFSDLSNIKFDNNISPNIIKRIPFSTETKFPTNSIIKANNKMYEIDEVIKKLHNNGITGEGINVAVIDYGFKVVHNELKDNIVSYTSFGEIESHFHGTVVSSKIVGKNLGVAPGAKLYFYEARRANQVEEVMKSLVDIYEKNKNGANIRVVNISASMHRESDKFDEIVSKLQTQNCYVIDSIIFGDKFTCINKDSITGEYYYSTWQEEKVNFFKSKIAIVSGGNFIPLNYTEDGYMYCGESSYSWCIPVFSGLFTLGLQINSNLTLENFINIAVENKKINENGIALFDIKNTFKSILENKGKNKCV